MTEFEGRCAFLLAPIMAMVWVSVNTLVMTCSSSSVAAAASVALCVLLLLLLLLRQPGRTPRGTAMAPCSRKNRDPIRPEPPITSHVASTSKAFSTVVVVGSRSRWCGCCRSRWCGCCRNTPVLLKLVIGTTRHPVTTKVRSKQFVKQKDCIVLVSGKSGFSVDGKNIENSFASSTSIHSSRASPKIPFVTP